MASILTDENFEKEINGSKKPVLVDFFATWCEPCAVLAPVLEKIADELSGQFILLKANLDDIPLTAQKFNVDRIPTVVIFKDGKPISGFVGVRAEKEIKEWLEKMIKENNESVISDEQEKIEQMIKEYDDYARKNGFMLNPDRKKVENIIRGSLKNEKKYGKKYCPCRRVTGNLKEDSKIICPCVYHLEELEKDGKCFCGLFVK